MMVPLKISNHIAFFWEGDSLFSCAMKKMVDRYTKYISFVVVPLAIVVAVAMGKKQPFAEQQEKMLTIGTKSIFLLLWPVVFGLVVGWDNVAKNAWVSIGFIWTVLALLWNLFLQPDGEDPAVRSSAQIVIGAAWAVGTLLAVSNKKGKWQPQNGARILLISLVLCIGFVVPSFVSKTDPPSQSTSIVRSFQQSILHYAIGLFVCGITISWVLPEQLSS